MYLLSKIELAALLEDSLLLTDIQEEAPTLVAEVRGRGEAGRREEAGELCSTYSRALKEERK